MYTEQECFNAIKNGFVWSINTDSGAGNLATEKAREYNQLLEKALEIFKRTRRIHELSTELDQNTAWAFGCEIGASLRHSHNMNQDIITPKNTFAQVLSWIPGINTIMVKLLNGSKLGKLVHEYFPNFLNTYNDAFSGGYRFSFNEEAVTKTGLIGTIKKTNIANALTRKVTIEDNLKNLSREQLNNLYNEAQNINQFVNQLNIQIDTTAQRNMNGFKAEFEGLVYKFAGEQRVNWLKENAKKINKLAAGKATVGLFQAMVINDPSKSGIPAETGFKIGSYLDRQAVGRVNQTCRSAAFLE
jgi:hypothetical protein